MPRDNLARLIARNPVPTNLRDRAAALRLTAARLMPPRHNGAPLVETSRGMPTDWSDPPEGFMAYPSLYPSCFLKLEHALPKEALRLHRLAQAELDRVTAPRDGGRDLPAAEVQRRRRALRVDELRAAAFGTPAEEAVDDGAEAGPSRVAMLAERIVAGRNRVVSFPDGMSDEEREAAHDDLARLEYELCDWPVKTPADLAHKARIVGSLIEGQLPIGEPNDLSARAWLGLRADVERIARRQPLAAVYRNQDDDADDLTRPFPVLVDADGRQSVDPVLLAIEAARFAKRRAQEELPGDLAPYGSPESRAAETEADRRAEANDAAFRMVFQLRPTTREGLFALIDYARECATDHSYPDAGPNLLGAIRDGAAMLMDGFREIVAPDPVFPAIEDERAAWQAANAPDLVDDEVERLGAAHDAPFAAMLATQPTTLPGLLALIRTLAEHEEWSTDDPRLDRALALVGDRLSWLMGQQASADADHVGA